MLVYRGPCFQRVYNRGFLLGILPYLQSGLSSKSSFHPILEAKVGLRTGSTNVSR